MGNWFRMRDWWLAGLENNKDWWLTELENDEHWWLTELEKKEDTNTTRIQDKKSKVSSGGNNSSISVHAGAMPGDLIGLKGSLKHKHSLLNKRSILTSDTLLHIVATLNRVETVKYLLECRGPGKVELEAKNSHGETPLHVAAMYGCNETVKMLLDYGANKGARTNNSMTPLRLAIAYAVQSGDDSTVKILEEYDALRSGDNSTVKTLAKNKNADCSVKDDEGVLSVNYPPAGRGLQNEEFPSQTNAEQIYHIEHGTTDNSWADYLVEPNNNDNGLGKKMLEFDNELSKIVGLHQLKLQLRTWAKGMFLDEKRREMGINLGPRKRPHMAFLGNPGTGKTTVARILGKLLKSVGVISSDNVTEVQRTDLIAEYVGQTGPKTRRKIEEAKGGILFVDEAYRLAVESSKNDFGVEALEEIMSVLEDGNIVVIFAGYTEPMKRVFSSNAGFCRRVTHVFEFDGFTCKDLADMLMLKMSKQDEKSRLYGFKLHPSCMYDAVLAVIERNSTETLRNKMNGGLVDHMLNNAREHLDWRLSFDSKGDELMTITLGDLEWGLRLLSSRMTLSGKEQRK